MKQFQIQVEVEMLATYKVKAETEAEAKSTALDYVYDGRMIQGWDIQSADVTDCCDESEEM